MPKFRTSDGVQGKILAVLPWEGGLTTQRAAQRAGLDEDITRRALEDLVRRDMVLIDDRGFWRKKAIEERWR